jgi:hypothetical protein
LLGVTILVVAILFIIRKRRRAQAPVNADPILETAAVKPHYTDDHLPKNAALQPGVQELPTEPPTRDHVGIPAELPASSPRQEVLSELASNTPLTLPISEVKSAPLSEMPANSPKPDAALVPAHAPIADIPVPASRAPESSTSIRGSVASAETVPKRTPSSVEKEVVVPGGAGQDLQSATATGSAAQTELAQLREEQARIQERRRRLQELQSLDELDEQVS